MSFRSFISVDLDVGEGIRGLCDELRNSGAALKVVNPDIMHLTLKFLGQVEEDQVGGIESAIRVSVEGIDPFTMKLHDVGAFPNRNKIKVVWVGIPNPGPLLRIAERLEESLFQLGFEREKREFKPHLTVARSRSPGGIASVQDILKRWRNTDFGVHTVDNIRLKKSVLGPKGPSYYTVREIGLSR